MFVLLAHHSISCGVSFMAFPTQFAPERWCSPGFGSQLYWEILSTPMVLMTIHMLEMIGLHFQIRTHLRCTTISNCWTLLYVDTLTSLYMHKTESLSLPTNYAPLPLIPRSVSGVTSGAKTVAGEPAHLNSNSCNFLQFVIHKVTYLCYALYFHYLFKLRPCLKSQGLLYLEVKASHSNQA